MRTRTVMGVLAAGLVLGASFVSPALAGPPLLCFPYEIGSAPSLPWGKDAFEQKKGYDKSKLVRETLELLKTEKSVLVRMETLRRAAVYIGQDKDLATELLAKISWIALDAEASGKPSAYAYFDAGILAATYRQSGADIKWRPGVAGDVDGYAYIKKALALEPDNAAMQFGAALVAHEHDQKAHRDHLRRAVNLAKPGSDLAKSIESNWACGHKPIDELKKELGASDSPVANKGG